MSSDRPATLLDPPYISGLVDSCGKFSVQITKSRNSSIGYYMSPTVEISRSNCGILFQHVEQFLEAYEIEYNIRESRPGHPNGISIKQPNEIRKFADAIGPYLIAEHRPAVLLIGEILPVYESGLNQSKQTFFEVMEFVEEIYDIRGQKSKYTREYFADLWANDIEVEEGLI